MMTGNDLKQWRTKSGLSQSQLMDELEIGSRQTIVNWEKSKKIPRLVELAVIALDRVASSRNFIQKTSLISDDEIDKSHWNRLKIATTELNECERKSFQNDTLETRISKSINST